MYYDHNLVTQTKCILKGSHFHNKILIQKLRFTKFIFNRKYNNYYYRFDQYIYLFSTVLYNEMYFIYFRQKTI